MKREESQAKSKRSLTVSIDMEDNGSATIAPKKGTEKKSVRKSQFSITLPCF